MYGGKKMKKKFTEPTIDFLNISTETIANDEGGGMPDVSIGVGESSNVPWNTNQFYWDPFKEE